MTYALVILSIDVVPACRSLDCVSVLALTASDAQYVAEIAAGRQAPAQPMLESTARETLYGIRKCCYSPFTDRASGFPLAGARE